MLDPGTIIGPLRIIRLLGRGGMGEVYEAEQIALRRRVAVKRIADHLTEHPESLRRFEREAQTIALVHSEHVVAVHEFGRHLDPAGRPHLLLVLELVEGGLSLRQVLDCGMLRWAAATAVIRQAARGLVAAAEHGIVHRDIKPDNLLLTRRGVVKLTDFGLAKALNSTSISLAGTLLGTPAYLAPELCTGGPADARSDLYALGATWFHLLAGRPPFAAETTFAMLHCHLNDPPPDVRELSPAVPAPVAVLIDRMLAKRPEQRPSDAAAIIAAIDGISATGHPVPGLVPELAQVPAAVARAAQAETITPTPTPATDPAAPTAQLAPPAPSEHGTRQPPRRRWIAPTVIAAAVVGIALMVWIEVKPRPPSPAAAEALGDSTPIRAEASAVVIAPPSEAAPSVAPPPVAAPAVAPALAISAGEIDALGQQLSAALATGRFGDAQRVAEDLAGKGLLPARVAAATDRWRAAEDGWLMNLTTAQGEIDSGQWVRAHTFLAEVPDDRVRATRFVADRREPLAAEVRRGAAAAFAEARLQVQDELDAGRPQMARHYLMMARPLADIARVLPDYERTMRRIEQAERVK